MDKINLYALLVAMYSELTIKVIIYSRNDNEKKEVKTYIGSVTRVRVEMMNNNDVKLAKLARVFYINHYEPGSNILEIGAEI